MSVASDPLLLVPKQSLTSKCADRIWNTKPWVRVRSVCFGGFSQARIKDLRLLPCRAEIGQYDKHIPEVGPTRLFTIY